MTDDAPEIDDEPRTWKISTILTFLFAGIEGEAAKDAHARGAS